MSAGAEVYGYKTEWLEESGGEEAGIKSATVRINGPDAEDRKRRAPPGAHLAVRFRRSASHQFRVGLDLPGGRRQDRGRDQRQGSRIDTYRSSGAGGQHVNKTDSAVRITHMPSGIVVRRQSERSQHQNRAYAFAMLRARLSEAELQRREAATDAMNATKTDIGWGHQIRSYVLQPYQMVKDLRTAVETSNTGAVLDGDLDRFLAARIEGADAIATNG
jgi:peptide chain release factor 2